MRRLLVVLLALLSLLAGCVADPSSDAEAAAVGAAAALDGGVVEAPFAEDGAIGPAAAGCPVVACVGWDGMSTRAWPIDGALTGLALELTWTASSPVMTNLRLGLGHGPDGQRSYEMVEGASPLAIEIAADEPYESPRVFVWATGTPGVEAYATTPQEFRLEGVLRFAASAAS